MTDPAPFQGTILTDEKTVLSISTEAAQNYQKLYRNKFKRAQCIIYIRRIYHYAPIALREAGNSWNLLWQPITNLENYIEGIPPLAERRVFLNKFFLDNR